ncbi:hypothetical protein B484DRAFT_406488, partial [Ochromonadaceae sp. CCMP2298]
KPSVLPTAAPSINDLVKFAAVQPITGVSVSEYQASRALYDQTLQYSIASSMLGVVPTDIINLDISATRRLRISTSTSTSTTTSTTSTLTYDVQVRDASLSYDTLTAQLTKSVTDGTFNSLLNGYATVFGATALESASSSSVATQNLEPGSLGGGGVGDSGGVDGAAIGGIAVAIVVFAALMAACAYFAYLRQGKTQALLDSAQKASMAKVELNTMNPVGAKGVEVEESEKIEENAPSVPLEYISDSSEVGPEVLNPVFAQ